VNRPQSFCLIIVVLISLLSGLALAQGGATGAIAGTVQDATGSAVPGAAIKVVSNATGQVVRTVTSDSSGAFTATLLPVGNYSVEVSAAGFAITKFPSIEVRITETTRITASVKPSVVKEVVEVESEAATVNTTDATTGESLVAATITDLPLATRNFQQLLDLSAGASANLNNAAALGRGDVRIDVNGGREDNNNYLIEGISASDYSFGELTYTPVPNPDDIQEFKVSTSLYDASQGRNGGGNINAVLKGGTSKFHGDLWEYFRNTDLDAHDFFLGKFVLKQNIFGGDFGGPVAPKAKLGYFYVNYQGTRQRSGDSLGTYINTSIPVLPGGAGNRSAAALASTFSSPATSGCPAIALTAADIDPVALALLNATGSQFGGGGGYLIPTVAGTPGVTQTSSCLSSVNYGPLVLSEPGRYTDNQFTVNWDKDLHGGKDHIAWRFFWSDSETYEPFGADNLQVQTGYPAYATNLNFPLDIPLRGRFGSIAETHTFSNTLINEFRFGVNVISDSLQNVPVAGTSPADLGISSVGAPDMYRFQFNTWQLGPFPNQLQSALGDSLVYLDTVSWTRAHHAFRFGIEVDRTSVRRDLPVLDNGLFYETDGSPFFGTSSETFSDFQNFLTGYTGLGEAGGGVYNHDYHLPGFGAFVQDDWRVRPDLTLNLGFRTEWVGAAYDSLCHLGNAVLSPSSAAQPFVYPSCAKGLNFPIVSAAATLNSAALNNEYATVPEPRIGLAYDVGGNHKTVIHAGYGIYSVREDIGAVDNLSFTAPFYPLSGGPSTPLSAGGLGLGCMFNSGPTSNCAAGGPFALPTLGTVSQNYAPVPSYFNGFLNCVTFLPTTDTTQCPNYGTPTGNIGLPVNDLFGLAVPLHWVVPTTQQWNLTVQRQLTGNWILELGYVGTKGTRLRSTFDPDQPALVGPGGTGQLPPITLTCGTSAVPCISGATGSTYTVATNTTGNATARAPYAPVNPALLEAFYPNSDSHYNGLQATVSHHFSKGLYLQSAYTYSKSIDDVSTASVAFITRFNDQNSGAASRGLSDFDHRQRFVTSFNYALPFLAERHDAMGYVVGGWETDAVLVAQSGSPITIADTNGASAYTPSSLPTATAEFAPGFGCNNALNTGSLQEKIANWVNPNAYLSAPVVPNSPDDATGYGDSPRNCIIGPKQFNLDFTLAKTFKIGERQNLRFRTEFFNILNHPSFQNPLVTGTANIADGSSVGQITQVNGTPRLVQFSLKYSF